MAATEAFAVAAPLQGTIVSFEVEVGARVAAGTTVVIIESMKMEHTVEAGDSGVVTAILAEVGATVAPGDHLLVLEPATVEVDAAAAGATADLDHVRDDLAAVVERHAYGLDENRPEAVERRRRTGQRTARENVADLVDDGTFIEYGALAIAAQRRRRSVQELIERTPGDGLVG